MVDDKYRALLDRQATEASLQLVADRGLALGVPVSTGVGFGDLDLHDLALLDPPCLPITGVNEQSMEPGIESVGVTNGADVQPCSKERLLDRIRGAVVASQDQPGGPMQPVERTCGQSREGIVVAVSSAKYEISLHRAPGWWRGPIGLAHPS